MFLKVFFSCDGINLPNLNSSHLPRGEIKDDVAESRRGDESRILFGVGRLVE